MEMILFVGAQGAGKSTFFHERFRDTHLRINLDMLRTRHRERGLVDACLAFKQPFVVDNTNPRRADRERYLAKAREAGFATVAYFFDTPVERLLANNAERSGKARIPDRAILATSRKLESPSLSEGFDVVYMVRTSEERRFVVTRVTDEI